MKSKKNKIIRAIIACFLMLIALGALCFGYVIHLQGHLADISDNSPILTTRINGQRVKTASSDVIFYRDNCPHCQNTIPYVYLINRFSGKHIQYRDLNVPINHRIGNEINDNSFPDSRTVFKQNHGINGLSSRPRPLIQMTKLQVISRISVLILINLLVSFAVFYW